MGRDELIDALQGAIEAQQGVEVALLFGSRARGEAGPSSDADLAVLAHGVDLVALAADLERAASVPVDVTDALRAPYPLLLEVLREGVPVFEREPGAYARFVSTTLASLETDLPALRMMERAFLERVARRGLLPTEP